MHRIHSPAFTGQAFNPCRGRPSRFAPLGRAGRPCIPTMYAAESLECAVHETVFHEIPYDAPVKTVDAGVVRALVHSVVLPTRDLKLCALFEPDLNRWGLTRGDLIDTLASRYAATAEWAIAIHDTDSDIDGLVWTSRRCDPEKACVLFGDRVGTSLALEARTSIGASPDRLAAVLKFGKRVGITLVI